MALLVVGGIGGIAFGAVSQRALTQSESTEFCISCHVMDATVFTEYQETIHYRNASGVRASCADCHVPDLHAPGQLASYLSVKFGAVRYIYGWATGRMSEPDQLIEKREELAQGVWDKMRANDSRECRSCHLPEAMDLSLQTKRAQEQHRDGEAEGKTCIDCHDDGIAHRPVVIAKPQSEAEEDDFMLE